MNFYKEVALIPLFHNGKPFKEGQTVREKVPLTEAQILELERTPTLTNCKYILITEEKAAKAVKAVDPNAPKKWAQMNAEERAAFKASKETPKTE
jgi:acyl-CoA reductase-like NAD-dependent aldehyde dehydrogenase